MAEIPGLESQSTLQGGTDASLKRENELLDLLSLMETDEGKRVLWRILSHVRPMHMSYVPGGRIEDMCFNEGRRSVGTWLLAEMNEADSQAFLKLQAFIGQLS